MRILPASIMGIPHGVEAKMKKLLKAILRANDIAELLTRCLTRRGRTLASSERLSLAPRHSST